MSKIHKKTGKVCIICDEESKEMVYLHKTRRQTHNMCNDCAIAYVTPIIKMAIDNLRRHIKIGVGKFKCPGTLHSEHRNHCENMISVDKLVINDESISTDIIRIGLVLASDFLYICPNEECGAVIELDPAYQDPKLSCFMCKTTWCRQCMHIPYHDGKSCVEIEVEDRNTDNARFIWEMKESGKLKFCPRCRVPIFKGSGCNKMSCVKCGVKWCWICNAIDIDYDHYNALNGTGCGNKLWQ